MRNGIFFPVLLILVGFYFLLRNYGVLPEWIDIWKLWPVVLIAVGVGALFRRGTYTRDQEPPKGS